MREHGLPVPDQGRKALHSERDDIFPDLHGLDLKGRLRAAFLTDRGLRLPVFLLIGQREACIETASRRWPGDEPAWQGRRSDRAVPADGGGGDRVRFPSPQVSAVTPGFPPRRRGTPVFRWGGLLHPKSIRGAPDVASSAAGRAPPVSERRLRPAGCGAVPRPARHHAGTLPARHAAARYGRASRAPRAGNRAGGVAAGPQAGPGCVQPG